MNRVAFALALAIVATTTAARTDDAAYQYRLHCSGCHGLDGMGSRVGRIPPFPGLFGAILGEPEGRRYLVLVPGVANSGLSDDATARVLNYVMKAWGDEAVRTARPYTAAEVADIRRTKVDDVVAWRGAIAEKLARRGVSIAY